MTCRECGTDLTAEERRMCRTCLGKDLADPCTTSLAGVDRAMTALRGASIIGDHAIVERARWWDLREATEWTLAAHLLRATAANMAGREVGHPGDIDKVRLACEAADDWRPLARKLVEVATEACREAESHRWTDRGRRAWVEGLVAWDAHRDIDPDARAAKPRTAADKARGR